MNLMENFKLAMNGLRANKMRAMLTMLGIIIGISSVIGIMTIGSAMTSSVNKSLSAFGATKIYMGVASESDDFDSQQTPTPDDYITDTMVKDIKHHFSNDISNILLTETAGAGEVRDGRNYAKVNYSGVEPAIKAVNNINLITGRFLSDRDLTGNRYTAVVSDKFVENLYRGDNNAALGKEFSAEVNNGLYTFTIVGVYENKEDPTAAMSGNTNTGKDMITTVYMPLTTAQSITGNNSGYQQIILDAKNSEQATELSNEIQDYTNDHFYKKNKTFKVNCMSMKSQLDEANGLLGTARLAISVIAGISLLVGGIGVMNIMLVSVTERTREIGTRKALGATNTNIRLQFIVESVIVCLIGGVIGILIGGGGGYLASLAIKTPTPPSIISILIAFTFSMFIGIFFGYYPANKAAQLDPIEALRYE